MLLTIHGWTWFEAQGGAKARSVVEAPALLDLPGAGGFWDIFLTGGTANARARRQWWRFIPNGLGGTGIVHPDPISKAHFTADSEVKILSHRRKKSCSERHDNLSLVFKSIYILISEEMADSQSDLVGNVQHQLHTHTKMISIYLSEEHNLWLTTVGQMHST